MKRYALGALCAGIVFTMQSGCIKRSADATVFGSQQDQSFDGVATHFDSLGIPYGGCGVPENILETTNYVALNVQDTPNDYSTFLQRPIADSSKVGAWDNGRNCGRWVHVTMGDFCQGSMNSGQKGSGLCQGGNWVADEFDGAGLDMLVTDSCQDDNVWCRDVRGHLDLATSSLEKFKPGLTNKWNNRKISWHYMDAPSYQGDVNIGFRKDAKTGWPAFIVTHLPRGLHGIEQQVNGSWQALKNDGDMGQSYVLQSTPDNTYKIRLTDAMDQLVNSGRIYSFAYPSSCGGSCPEAFNKVDYTTVGSDGTPSQIVQQTPDPSPPSAPVPSTPSPQPAQVPAADQSAQSPPTSQVASGGVTASIRIKSTWQTGYCADLVVHNATGQKLNSWSVTLRANGTSISQNWNINVTKTSNGYTVSPAASWNSMVDDQADMANEGFCVDLNGSSQQMSVDSASGQ